jgi:hypothetical protein
LVLHTPIWAEFSQFGKISANFGVGSAKIGGGNSTARIRPFLNEFQLFTLYTVIPFATNSFKNGRMRAAEFPSPILVH